MTEKSFDLTAASKAIAESGKGIPPLEKWNPDFCGDIDMRIARDGRWLYMGTPIGRQAMVDLFATVLWFEEGKYYLKTPVEKVGIEVEDAPFLFTQLEIITDEQGEALCFISTTRDRVVVSAENPLWVEQDKTTGEPSPYVNVRFGMKGLLHRNLFYQLVERAQIEKVEGRDALVIRSAGEVFSLGWCD